MSLIKGNKSVLTNGHPQAPSFYGGVRVTLQLKEMIKNQHKEDSMALMGLGAIMVGTIVLPTMVKLGKPILKSLIKSGLALYPPKKPLHNSKLEFQQLKLISPRNNDLNLN